ncbi:nuclear transport factor 2 family protein [Microbacterium sp. SLBN-111]|uniref:nuclear transport factor 2 family protein n=1 Tax=Microbacterium sp. SLBN-111 TaxID=3377733 RepID=UPI003C710F6F
MNSESSTQTAPTDVESVVRRYYAVVSDLSSAEDDLRHVLASDVSVIEHPNALVRSGARRDLAQTLEGFHRGKALLRAQTFDVHDVLVQGDRAAVRATWTGVIAHDAGPFRAGQELVAHVAATLVVRDGLIVEHETFDCYEPFDTVAA